MTNLLAYVSMIGHLKIARHHVARTRLTPEVLGYYGILRTCSCGKEWLKVV